jgi:hypothetical protein
MAGGEVTSTSLSNTLSDSESCYSEKFHDSMRKKIWVYSPPKSKVPDIVKAEVETKATELVNAFLKPEYIKPPPKNAKWNYIIDLYTKWHRNYFYLCATYACPSPNAISPYFNMGFARLGYAGGIGRQSRFNLSYMRHTGKWWVIWRGLSLEQCLVEIRGGGIFHP